VIEHQHFRHRLALGCRDESKPSPFTCSERVIKNRTTRSTEQIMLDALTLDQIRTFVTVADSGSFRSGAARLLRVQSAISHAIANLEAELGLQLFDRSGYRPVLTPEGQALLANARDILLRADAMRARARALGAGVELGLSLVADTLFP